MGKFIFALLLMSSPAFATSDFTDWKWGVGFSQLNGTQGGVHFEVGSPVFNKEAPFLSSLVLTYDAFGTEIESADEDNYVMNSGKLFWEFRHLPYKEILSYYFRLGAGYDWMNKYVNSDGGFAVAGFQLGTDFIIQDNANGEDRKSVV